MRNAHGHDEVDDGRATEPCDDYSAQGSFIALRVGDHEESSRSVVRGGRSLRAHAGAFERKRRQSTQAEQDDRHDRKPGPAERRWPNEERDDDRVRGYSRTDRGEDHSNPRPHAPSAGAHLRSHEKGLSESAVRERPSA